MRSYLIFLCLYILCSPLKAQTLMLDSTQLTISVAIDSSKLVAPWDIEWGFDDRLWMTDCKDVKAWDLVSKSMKSLYRVSRGYCMGLAVPKVQPSTGSIYVYVVIDTAYYYLSGSLAHLYRFEYAPATDTLLNPLLLLSFPHLSEHSGGKVAIGADGKILLTTAEFTFTNDIPGALNGRVLRMNPDGSVPTGNLRPDRTFSIGHRNSQGMVVLPDGKIYCTEHSGPALYDEVNYITLGGHYGWPAMQGYNNCTMMAPDSCSSPSFIAGHKRPAYSGVLTPAGLDYYDHPAIPEWRNSLIVGTLYGPDTCLAVLKLNTAHDTILGRRSYLKKNIGGLNDFRRTRDVCVAPDGSIYCIVHDRSFSAVGDSLYNLTTRIVQLKNNVYVNDVAAHDVSSTPVLYPNPVSSYLNVRLKDVSGRVAYDIYDMQGRVVDRGMREARDFYIDIRNYSPGVYELLLDKGAKYHGRFVVIH